MTGTCYFIKDLVLFVISSRETLNDVEIGGDHSDEADAWVDRLP